MTKNVKIMFLLLLVAFLYTFVFGCEDSVTISTKGAVDNCEVKGLDTAIEKMAEPVLYCVDAAVGALRDAETAIIKEATK